MEGDSHFSLQALLGRWCAWLQFVFILTNEWNHEWCCRNVDSTSYNCPWHMPCFFSMSTHSTKCMRHHPLWAPPQVFQTDCLSPLKMSTLEGFIPFFKKWFPLAKVTNAYCSSETRCMKGKLFISLFQFSSVAQSCPTLCDPMNRSSSGLPVHL